MAFDTNEILKGRLSRNGGLHHLTQEETERIKAVVLEAALDVAALCDELGIPYMLGGGSALGAVRHRGFIPWDDDMDLNIPRAHIDMLLDAIGERFPEKYYVEAPLRTPGYLSSFIQVHRRGTVFQEYLAQDISQCGIKLDIFVIENTYDNKLRRAWHGICAEAGLFALSCYRMFSWRGDFLELASEDRRARLLIKAKGIIGAVFAVAPNRLYKSVQHCLMRCRDDGSKYVTVPSGRKHFFGEMYERGSFLKLQKMPFEGHELSVTADYDAYLTNLYGEYMKIPPEEEREHHAIRMLRLPGEGGPRLLEKPEVQGLLVTMLDSFVAFCVKNNLRYYLVGGTLLGAVRHRGFIPWDDDIDVGMPRPDYEKFLELTDTEDVAPHMRVISGSRGSLPNPYAQLASTNTRLERDSSQYIRKKCQTLNLFIDIFPQDGWPEDDGKARRLAVWAKRQRYFIQCARSQLFKGVSFKRIIAKTPMVMIMRLVGVRRLVDGLDRRARQYDYDTSKYVGAITYGIYGVGERCRRDEVVNFTEVTFEGKEYVSPGCPDRYLSQVFGDYMTLPPDDERKDHRMRVWLVD
ncbi:MAG: LicD family protein [Clostridiales bacterium]|nr:LicD family protein [Clostridiales bacterium]